MQLLETYKHGLDQLHKLNEEQLKQVKDCMVEHSGHFALRRLLHKDFNQGALDYGRIAPAVISCLVDLAAKKAPADLPFSNKQVD